MVSVRDTGERGLLARLAEVVGPQPGLLLGIGDDAAIWRPFGGDMVATTDMLVEGIHFDLGFTSWRDLGWKALAVNLSDVAAMGAAPVLALVSLGLRAQTRVEDVLELYAGLCDLASQSGCAIAGGDTVSVHAETVISVVALGRGGDSGALLRRGAGHPGDVLAVTGALGASAAGLRLLQGHRMDHPALLDAHRRPIPRLAAGQALVSAGARCAMDLSDGLLIDLEKLCAASGCGAEIHEAAIPIHPAVREVFPDHALDLALGGGEDYELLCAGPADLLQRARAALDLPLTEIGRLVDGAGIRLLDAHGRERPLPPAGWDHFSRPSP